MKIIVGISILLLAVLGGACATRNVYDGFRFRQEMDCRQLSGMDRDQCQRNSGMSYDEYERRLKERDQTQ
jgi:hypothetical protein